MVKKLLYFALPALFVAACTSETSLTEKEKKEEIKKYAEITEAKDTLFAVGEDRFYGSSYAFANRYGENIFPAGTFESCFSDTFATYAWVFDKKRFGDGMVAINRNKEVIFDVFLFDNGPDYLSEGLFRIMRNGKIGYANKSGQVVIEPKYSCAYPFEDGKAKVADECKQTKEDEHTKWESESWYYIDKNGKKVK